MKFKFIQILLFALLTVITASAQTVAITSTEVEVISRNAVTRTFYDLDDVYFKYKNGKVVLYDVESQSALFSGDTSEVSVAGALIWSAKMSRLSNWYQSATDTDGFRYFVPRRNVNYLYRGATSVVRLLNNTNKRTILETHIDSVTVAGVTGASNKLTWLRNQAFLEGLQTQQGLPGAPTVAAGAAAGTGPTVTISGTASDWTLTLTTGTSTTSTGVLATVTLPNTYLTAPVPLLNQADEDSAAHLNRVFATSTTTTWVLNATGTALTAGGTVYVFTGGVRGR